MEAVNTCPEGGAAILYRGERLFVTVAADPEIRKSVVSVQGNRLVVTAAAPDAHTVRNALQNFMTRECRRILLKRIARYQVHFKVKPSAVEVKSMVAKWGQCSADRRLVFNWRLVMAPPEVMDYVVVHEMCHLVHLNHDRSFWRLVGRIMPSHEACSEWLDRYGHNMDF